MKNKRFFGVLALLAAGALIMAACGSAPAAAPSGPLAFDGADIEAIQTIRGADFGVTEGPGGGQAFFITSAKTALESGTYELLFIRPRPVNVTPYSYIVFEMAADNLDLLDDIGGFFPRLRLGTTYVQFNATAAFRTAVASVSEPGQWFEVSAPIQNENIHENGENFKSMKARAEIVMFRFICKDMENIDGKIFFRNIHFE